MGVTYTTTSAATYVPIATNTVSGTTTNLITFSSIPSTFTDLVLIDNGKFSASDNSYIMTFNGDTANNYSFTYIYGNGTSAVSGKVSNQSGIFVTRADNNVFSAGKTHINNYANATTYKTAIGSGGTSDGLVISIVGLWRSTAAITSLSLSSTTQFFVAGSMYTLFGILGA